MNEEKSQVTAKETGKRGLTSLLFSRFFVFFFVILLQIAFLWMLATYSSRIPWINYAIIFFQLILIVFFANRTYNQKQAILWILLLVAAPACGVGFYLYTRFQPETIRLKKRLAEVEKDSQGTLSFDDCMSLEEIEASPISDISRYMYDCTGIPPYKNNVTKYFVSGEESFSYIIDALNSAEHFIFIEFFIINGGQVWDAILKILEQKAEEGVEVYVMYDGFCSLNKLPIGYYKTLNKKKIHAKPFAPARPIFTTQQNNRDHRKVLVVDGKIAFTGGINLADEYMNITSPFGYWKDVGVMIKGDAVNGFSLMFMQMWNIGEKEKLVYNDYIMDGYPQVDNAGFVIPYYDEPFDDDRVCESIYLHIINSAEKYVHIITPYLLLDTVMITALQFAAKRGVEVIIIMPGKPDKAFAYCGGRTYYPELINAGVKIYEFKPGFTHAKLFVSDGIKATVGSPNLDYRSLYLHFENGCYFYGEPEIMRMEEDYQNVLTKSKQVTIEECKKRNIFYKLFGEIMRIISPLL